MQAKATPFKRRVCFNVSLKSRATGTIAITRSSPRPMASKATNEGISLQEEDGSHVADIGRHTSSGFMQSAMQNAADIIILIVICRRFESMTPNSFRMERRADTRRRVFTHPQRISLTDKFHSTYFQPLSRS